MDTKILITALKKFCTDFSLQGTDLSTLNCYSSPVPAESEVIQEYTRILSLEPLRLLREQRDTIHLPAWDKEVQIKFTNNNLPIPQNYLDWKQAYLDLPQNIAAGTIPAPTLDANGQFVFNDWPVFVP